MARKKKSDGLTPRQRQSQQIMQSKTARKKRRALMRKCSFVGGGCLSVLLMVAGAYGLHTGWFSKTSNMIVDGVYATTADAGFALDGLYLQGRSRTSVKEIERVMHIAPGDPILRIPLEELKARLENIESIKKAEVERALPSTLYVRIVEREPVALWQYKGDIALIDDNGVVMPGMDIVPYKHLPLIVGQGAPAHVRELIRILSSDGELMKRFSSATRISDRRWNIRLKNDEGLIVEVRLPESNAPIAWRKLAQIEQNQRLLDRDIKVIDLRLDGKVFIKLSPNVFTEKSSSARET